ncbi:Dynamin-related protein 3A [Linum grandiflorum]
MDRGTDARNLLLGKVVPLRLGYVGVVNRSQEDINLNRTIKDALAAEEKFFRSRPVYNSLADRCGIPQLAKKLNHILVQHIKGILPVLKSRISDALVSTAKEHASYGEMTESKAGQGALLLNIFSKYGKAFSSMLEGENEETSTCQLSGLARIKYVFQSIFVKSLEGVDPCEDLTDDDIRIAIQNGCGSNAALFVPVGPFEVLVRRQIARLLYPSLQCARFIYDELIKISHRCLANELERFPVLKKRMDEVIVNLLRDGLEPSETMIGHLIEMEMDYINTAHPNFIGGTKAVETAEQQVKSARAAVISRPKDPTTEAVKAPPASERSLKSRSILGRAVNGGSVNGAVPPDQAINQVADAEKVAPSGKSNLGGSSWGISSIFRGSNSSRIPSEKSSTSMSYMEAVPGSDPLDKSLSTIHLQEPPEMLRPSESPSEQESIEIVVIKLLLQSYYNIVRKNVEDLVPKTIMHFLVHHAKRDLHNVMIKKLYRENLFEEMLQEPDEISLKRKRTRDTLKVLQQAFRTLEELPLEAESVERGQSSGPDATGLPKLHGFPLSSASNGLYTGSSPNHRKSRKSSASSPSHSGDLQSQSQSHYYPMVDSTGSGRGAYLASL